MNLTGPINSYVEKMLDVTARRQEVLSSNLANLDTPGYKAKDLAFQQEFQQEMTSSLPLTRTNAAHIASSSPGTGSGNLAVVDSEMPEKWNGNNVDLEQQMMAQNKNGMEYVMLTQYLGSTIKTLRSAIIDGGRG